MAERFDVAALRHLATADILAREAPSRPDDAGYHYGLAGEMAIKQSLTIAGVRIDKPLRRHINDKHGSLQAAVQDATHLLSVLAAGRRGGGIAADLRAKTLTNRFVGWSLNIRYADTDFPVDPTNLAAWKADAIALVNNGAF